MIRFLNNKTISDRINTDTLLTNINLLSVNRMNAQIKLTEVWKASHNKNSPLNIEMPIINPEHRSARSKANGRLIN